MIKRAAPLLIDGLDGSIGTLLGKDEMGDKVSFKYRPLNGRPWDTRWTRPVPKEGGFVEIPAAKLKTDYSWVFTTSDGNSRGIVMEELGLHYEGVVKKMEASSKIARLSQAAANIKERGVERKIDAKVQERLESTQLLRRGFRRPRGLRDEEEYI